MSHYLTHVVGDDPGALLAPHEEDEHAMGIWDWYVIGGRWAETLVTKSGECVDRTTVGQLTEAYVVPFYFVHASGLQARELWNGEDFVRDDDHDVKVLALLVSLPPDTVITVYDLHC